MFTAMAIATMAAGSLLSAMGKNSAAAQQSKQAAAINKQHLLSASQDVSALNIQAGQLAQDATQKRAEAVRIAQQTSGEQSALAGASGTRGASVDAVQSDIDMQLGQQNDQIAQNLSNQLFSIQQQRSGAYTSARNKMQSGTSGQSTTGLLGGFGMSVLNGYASGFLKFGSTGAGGNA